MKMPRRVIYESKFCNWMNLKGCVIWPFILLKYKRVETPYATFAHEMTHWAQIQEVGIIRFYLSYFWQQIRVGYANNKWEYEPRLAWAYPDWYDYYSMETGNVIEYWNTEAANRKNLGELGQFL